VTDTAAPTARPAIWHWLLAAVLAVAVTCIYAWASANNELIFDDYSMIVDAEPVQSIGDFARLFVTDDGTTLPYYRPITRATLQIQKAIHGENPLPFHIFNAVLIGVVYLATFGLLARPAMRSAAVPALLGAALFVMHPLASSCVHPISSGRETLLASMFMVISTWAYLGRGHASRVIALLAFAAALWCRLYSANPGRSPTSANVAAGG